MLINNFLKKKYQSRNTEFTPPYIIAEIGVNHEGSIKLAKQLIKQAKRGGASAVKFQAYKADTLVVKSAKAYWDTSKEKISSQHELFKKHEGFWETEMIKLKLFCDEINIDFICTPFDEESAVFLNKIVKVHKISSSDITNKPFIEKIAKFKKPIILSTGASEMHEIVEAVNWIHNYNTPVCLLHCVLNYPTPDHQANLGMIKLLQKEFPEQVIGYSDHTLPGNMENCFNAFLLGAEVIEKHFTHNKNLSGNDHYHAMDENDLKIFNEKITQFSLTFGNNQTFSIKNQMKAKLNARRSLISNKKINKNSKIKLTDLTYKRPGTGVSPKYINDIVGSIANRDIESDMIIEWNFVSKAKK